MSKKGFTLIEILVVVAIIGLLASVILIGLGSFRARGRDARRIADLREIQNGLELYYTRYQLYPAITGPNSWDTLKNSLVNAGIGVSSIPNDPLNTATYNYRYAATTDQQNYVLAATLEDVNNSNLKDQGTIYGIDCNKPVYCIQF